jgi:hypothetical protein
MSMLDEAIKAHFDNGANAKFSKIDKFNGGILEIPENILTKKVAYKCVYEVDDEGVIIYINGIKDKTVKCPQYACRPLVSMDIIFRMTHMGYMPFLLKVIKDNEELVLDEEMQTKTAALVLDVPDKKNKRLEDKLYIAINTFFSNGIEPQTNIKDGFDIIHKHYDGELNDISKKA